MSTNEDKRQRYWLVFVDDTIHSDLPMTASVAVMDFLRTIEMYDLHTKVELIQCTREALDWSGITDGIGVDELDDEEAVV